MNRPGTTTTEQNPTKTFESTAPQGRQDVQGLQPQENPTNTFESTAPQGRQDVQGLQPRENPTNAFESTVPGAAGRSGITTVRKTLLGYTVPEGHPEELRPSRHGWYI